LKVEDVLSVYSGIDGKCCCGCSGKHTYNPMYVDEGTKKRGYPVKESEVSKRVVSMVLNKVKGSMQAEVDGDMVTTVIGRRLYIVYLRSSN